MPLFLCRYDPTAPTDFGLGMLYGSPAGDVAISTLFGVEDVLHPFGHSGIDLAAAEGTPIHAPTDGTVTLAGWFGDFGNCVIIDHGDIVSLYGHLRYAPSSLSAGTGVSRGTFLGYVGNTGFSRGPHLHFGTAPASNPRLNFPPSEGPIGYLIDPLSLCEPEEDAMPLVLESLNQSEAIEAVKASAFAVGPDGGQWYEVKDGYTPKPGRRAYLVEVVE